MLMLDSLAAGLKLSELSADPPVKDLGGMESFFGGSLGLSTGLGNSFGFERVGVKSKLLDLSPGDDGGGVGVVVVVTSPFPPPPPVLPPPPLPGIRGNCRGMVVVKVVEVTGALFLLSPVVSGLGLLLLDGITVISGGG